MRLLLRLPSTWAVLRADIRDSLALRSSGDSATQPFHPGRCIAADAGADGGGDVNAADADDDTDDGDANDDSADEDDDEDDDCDDDDDDDDMGVVWRTGGP